MNAKKREPYEAKAKQGEERYEDEKARDALSPPLHATEDMAGRSTRHSNGNTDEQDVKEELL